MDKKQLCAYIDHTLLKPATKKQIKQICQEAMDNNFASVCVQPDYVKFCCKQLYGSQVKVCTVIGFPLGENTTKTKVFEAKDAIKNGAQELDMVINASWAKGNEWKKVFKEIEAVVKAAKGVCVKVIIETCLLTDEQIKKASQCVIDANAQFVKTSTGFSTGGATVHAVEVIHSVTKGTSVKIKAAGGISNFDDAREMVNAGANRLGTSKGVLLVQ